MVVGCPRTRGGEGWLLCLLTWVNLSRHVLSCDCSQDPFPFHRPREQRPLFLRTILVVSCFLLWGFWVPDVLHNALSNWGSLLDVFLTAKLRLLKDNLKCIVSLPLSHVPFLKTAILLFLSFYVYKPACLYVYCVYTRASRGQKTAPGFLELEFLGTVDHWCGCWELNLNPL